MAGTKTFILNLLASTCLLAQTDYFPLQTGNQWIYQGTDSAYTVEVGPAQAFGSNSYFLVTGLPSTPQVLLRKDEAGRILMYDSTAKQEKVWLDPTADRAATGVDSCNAESVIESREAKYSGPIGDFVTALAVKYTFGGCADAGLESDVYLPSVGLVQRKWQTIAGTRQFDLVYAKLGETTFIRGSEVSFTLAINRASFQPATRWFNSTPLIARMTLNNSTDETLEAVFNSGQTYDLVIRNDKGESVYRWSATRTFPAVVRQEKFPRGEKTWVEQIPLTTSDGSALPAGRYSLEAFLTTDHPKPYGATVNFQILPEK
jgi:hypothetical protein